MGAVSTFDVSVVEDGNLCGLEFILVVVCAHGILNPLNNFFFTSYMNSFFAMM